MMIKFGESGHPVFCVMSSLSRGTLKSKGGGQLSIHFCADGDTIETVFRTIISVNQLRIYGTVSDLCEDHSACVKTIPPNTAIQEQTTTINGYGKVCTTTSTLSTTVRPLWTIT